MLPKFSLVSIGCHDDVLNWVAKYKPVSLIVVNERGQSNPERPWENNEIEAMRWAMSASPKTLWIFRSWPDGIGEGSHLATRVSKCFEPFMDLPNPKMGHSFNEPGFPWIGSPGDARKLSDNEALFARVMHGHGLLSMNFCFSESHILKGNMGLWEIYADALPYVDALGFNEYDWPSVFTSRDQGYKWRIGHWEHQVAKIRSLGIDPPPVILGEGILDGKIKYPYPFGWQKLMAGRRYVNEHRAVHTDTYHKPGVFSHHTFCYCHITSEWRSYNVKPILPQLGQLIDKQVYWEDSGGESMETDSPLATWREGVPLGNYTKGPTEKTEIVLHSTGGSFTSAVNWFLNPASGFATHYVIGRGHAGVPKIYQLVRESDIGHHAGKWEVNVKSIGIECADDKLDYLTAPQWDRLVALLRDIVKRHPNIGRSDIILHREIVATRCPQAISDTERDQTVAEVFGGPVVDPNQDVLESVARIKSKAQGARYLLEQIEEEADAIEDRLIGA